MTDEKFFAKAHPRLLQWLLERNEEEAAKMRADVALMEETAACIQWHLDDKKARGIDSWE